MNMRDRLKAAEAAGLIATLGEPNPINEPPHSALPSRNESTIYETCEEALREVFNRHSCCELLTEATAAVNEAMCKWTDGLSAPSETTFKRDALLADLRQRCNVDENGDPVGAQPEPGWETGYSAGTRTVYRILRDAAPDAGSTSGGDSAPAAPVAAPAFVASTACSGWIACSDRMPGDETPALIIRNGEIRIGELRWEKPSFEETFQAFRYWDDPQDDGQAWEHHEITHWQPLPAFPSSWERKT